MANLAQSSRPYGYTVSQERPQCSRKVYVWLALLLGWVGVHNFKAGRKDSAVVQLMLTLSGFALGRVPWAVVGIWVIIEICAVTADGNGVRMA